MTLSKIVWVAERSELCVCLCLVLAGLAEHRRDFCRCTRKAPTRTKTNLTYNFQRWMSRFPQRWRTQRNAIRNANCKTSWIIKILNAHCAFGIFLKACLSEYLWTKLRVGPSFFWFFVLQKGQNKLGGHLDVMPVPRWLFSHNQLWLGWNFCGMFETMPCVCDCWKKVGILVHVCVVFSCPIRFLVRA